VNVRTDLAVVAELAGVRVTISQGGRVRATGERVAVHGDPWFDGLRVADAAGLRAAQTEIVASALDVFGDVLAERTVVVDLDASRVVTVILTRDCRGVVCPTAARPGATTCVAGACVAPSCLDDEAACAPECTGDGECGSSAACAEARCVEGACLFRVAADACAPGMYCDPETGCRMITVAIRDGGVRDASASDAAPALDAGTACIPVAETCDGRDDDCDGSIDDGADCGTDWVRRERAGHSYVFRDWAFGFPPTNYATAETECARRGYHVVQIDDEAERVFVTTEARSMTRAEGWWTGVDDRTTEGRFAWWDGAEATFLPWDATQPDDRSPGEDCALVHEALSWDRWHDVSCDEVMGIVCESL
jgi:hypothetical protein